MDKFNQPFEHTNNREASLKGDEVISDFETLGEKEENLNIEELHSMVEKLNSELNFKEPSLTKIEQDLDKTKEKLPKVDGHYEDQVYKEFCESLGDYEQKIGTLEKMQKELTAEFIANNKEEENVKIKNQISLLSELVMDLKRLKTDNIDYDNLQFLKRSRNVLPHLSFLKGSLENLSRKYREFLNEKIKNNQTLELIKNDPKTRMLENEIKELQTSYDQLSDEVANLKLERYNALIKISKIEESSKE